MKRFLSATTVVVASALLLAGCGGGGSDPEPVDPPVTEPMGPTDAQLLEDAVDAASDAMDAQEAAETLLEGAVTASKALTAAAVDGSSRMAYDNTMTVLNARALIEIQQGNAEDAVETAQGIDTEGMSQADMDRINKLVMDAEGALEKINEILNAEDTEDGSLAMAEADIRSGASVTATPAEIAQAKAKVVSDAIAAAIRPDDATTVTTSPALAMAPDGKVKIVGTMGMTFREIAGGSERMAIGNTSEVAADAQGTALGALTATERTTQAAYYKGIEGNLVCDTAACEADTDGKVTGDLFFIPTPANAAIRFVMAVVGGNYVPVTNSATYGYWLDAANAIHLHASTLTPGSGDGALSWDRGTATADVEASYTGDAKGYSHRTVGEGDDATTASGEFTADVTLNATFGASETTLDGYIAGFEGGAHANPAWRVTLGGATRSDNTYTGTVTPGDAHGDHFASDGDWTAHAYGAGEKHASGFVGAFDAAFGDGEAAGVFHATD